MSKLVAKLALFAVFWGVIISLSYAYDIRWYQAWSLAIVGIINVILSIYVKEKL